jgi:hypothetical protein
LQTSQVIYHGLEKGSRLITTHHSTVISIIEQI